MKNTIIAISDIISTAENFRNAYFWTSPSSAASRRSYEKRYTCPTVEWTDGGHIYSAAFSVSCSCKNIYAAGHYTRDGQKTTLTAIKNSLRRLEADQNSRAAAVPA